MKKTLAYIVLLAAFILVTFFGLGPVILADGSRAERVGTFFVVLILYAILAVLYRIIRNKMK